MKLLVIFGPQSVGKMTVGHELEKITGLKLFHNHMSIEMVSPFFSYSTEQGKKLVNLFREEIFKAVASSDLEGLIFTYVWAFDSRQDWEYVEKLEKIFKDNDSEVYYVELEAPLEERIKRNRTEHRLAHKPTKRDIESSEKRLIEIESEHRTTSNEGEIKKGNYLRIDNTNLSAESVARKIKEAFSL